MSTSAPHPDDVAVFADEAGFRSWLEQHHADTDELWVGYYRKAVPKTSMTYRQAVEEALCFGWIDGIGRRIDDEVSANRYTPRRRSSSWSAVNITLVGQLTASGRMRPAGLRAFEVRDRRKDAIYSYENPPAELPAEYEQQLRDDVAAWAYWSSRPPGYRRIAASWVVTAKRQETRERRMATLVQDCAAGRPIRSQRYGTP